MYDAFKSYKEKVVEIKFSSQSMTIPTNALCLSSMMFTFESVSGNYRSNYLCVRSGKKTVSCIIYVNTMIYGTTKWLIRSQLVTT